MIMLNIDSRNQGISCTLQKGALLQVDCAARHENSRRAVETIWIEGICRPKSLIQVHFKGVRDLPNAYATITMQCTLTSSKRLGLTFFRFVKLRSCTFDIFLHEEELLHARKLLCVRGSR